MSKEMRRKRRTIRNASLDKPYLSLRQFLETSVVNMLAGKVSLQDVVSMLDMIEQGLGLDERDRHLAERFGYLPGDDQSNPTWLRGYDEGHLAAILEYERASKAGEVPFAPKAEDADSTSSSDAPGPGLDTEPPQEDGAVH